MVLISAAKPNPFFDREPSRSYTYLWSFHFISPSFHVLSENRVNSHHLLQSTDWTIVAQLSSSCQAVVRQSSGSRQAVVGQSSGSNQAVIIESMSILVLWKMLLICHARGHWKSFAWPCFSFKNQKKTDLHFWAGKLKFCNFFLDDQNYE